MKKIAILLFLVPSSLFSQEKLGSWKDTTTSTGCKYLSVEKIKIEIDEIKLITSKDTGSVLLITIKNSCKSCVKSGPDYTGLIVYDSSGKIIAQAAINGIPQNGKSRLYYVECEERLYSVPANIKVSLIHYCTDIPVKKK